MVRTNIVPAGLDLAEMKADNERLRLSVSSTQIKARCPKCGVASAHVHSRYSRLVKDLPCFGLGVLWQLQVRRFFCHNLGCQQRIFCERLSGVVSTGGRFSSRLNEIISFIGLANGGQAGARLAARLSISVSHDTLLRRLRSLSIEENALVRVLGIDDWALRKGQHYGTILVDLERHCVIDLLPDRSAETVSHWLKQHPEIEIISRDRANAYIEAAHKGAPQAQQVADRFHLLCNLTDAVERFLKANSKYLKQAREAVDTQLLETQPQIAPNDQPLSDESNISVTEQIIIPQTVTTQASKQDLRYERYQQVRALHQQGASIRAIAHHLRMHRQQVRLFICSQSYPERANPPVVN